MIKSKKEFDDLLDKAFDKYINDPDSEDEFNDLLKYGIEKYNDILCMINYMETCMSYKNYDVAIKLAIRIINEANQENKQALGISYTNIGLICKDELGDYYNPEKAYSNFLIGSSLGNINGMMEVAKCYMEGFCVKRNLNRYQEILEMIINVGSEDDNLCLLYASYELAELYYGKKDFKNAKEKIGKAKKIYKKMYGINRADKKLGEDIKDLEKKISTSLKNK